MSEYEPQAGDRVEITPQDRPFVPPPTGSGAHYCARPGEAAITGLTGPSTTIPSNGPSAVRVHEAAPGIDWFVTTTRAAWDDDTVAAVKAALVAPRPVAGDR